MNFKRVCGFLRIFKSFINLDRVSADVHYGDRPQVLVSLPLLFACMFAVLRLGRCACVQAPDRSDW